MDLWRGIRNVENGPHLGTNSMYTRGLSINLFLFWGMSSKDSANKSTSTIFLHSHRKSHWSTLWISYPSPITLLFVVLRKGLKTFHIQRICFLYNKHKLYWFPRSRKFVKLLGPCCVFVALCSGGVRWRWAHPGTLDPGRLVGTPD